jgi:eukaryotic-like serine/threonine-protein kinase
MADFDAETLAEQAVLIGLLTREQVRQVRAEADDGSIEAMSRVLLRKGLLTSWQLERIKKGEVSGFFFGGCKVLFHIAEGTFARVYRGRKLPGNQSVAVKVLRRRFTTDQEAVARFNQEAEAGMKLVHPNIVRIYDYGEQDKNYYMIMEFVEGSNLRDFLKIRARLTPSEAMPVMIGLAQALKYSLEQGVTHRDIKGTNILISTRGEAKLVDFGLATIEGDERRMAVAHGQRTVDYSALERTCGSPKGDPRSDIYFLGCVFYQMLTGVVPMPEVESKDPLAKMLKRSFGAIKPITEHRHAPPEEICRVVEKMMKIDLKHRYQTMEEVITDLEACKAALAAAAAAPPSRKRVARAPERAARPKAATAPAGESIDSVFTTIDEDPFAGDIFEHKAVPTKHVLCVEVQEPIQEAFRKTLSQMGYRVLLVRDAERAAERYRESPPDAVVFDADGLGPEALDAFIDMHEKAHEDGHDLAALVLLGPRQGALTSKLPTDDRLVVLSKPLKMKDVQDAITQLVPLE